MPPDRGDKTARVRILDSAGPDFAARFENLVAAPRGDDAEVDDIVRPIIADIRRRGDAALLEWTEKLDGFKPNAATLAVSGAELDAAVAACDAETMAALELALRRIRSLHQRQFPQAVDMTDAAGVRLGYRWTAIGAAGIYVPGGSASYPSSVLMNAVPAKVAGVGRIVMTVPAPGGVVAPLVLAAARLAGVDEVYRIGGAQAIAALAYGTATIAAVDKIVGPGNAYVAAAKRLVFGQVGIDTVAGPSEILVVADGGNDPAWIAADLLSQAEHDAAAQSILITDDRGFAERVEAAIEAQLARLGRAAVARRSWYRHGAIILVGDLGEAPSLVDRLAPEHVELAVADPEPLAAAIRNAGAMFLGRWTPEAIGDYVAGTNHVLPTARTARFGSGLGVLDFMKRTSFVACDAASLAAIGPAALRLAEAEGFGAHALSVDIRLRSRSPS